MGQTYTKVTSPLPFGVHVSSILLLLEGLEWVTAAQGNSLPVVPLHSPLVIGRLLLAFWAWTTKPLKVRPDNPFSTTVNRKINDRIKSFIFF